MSSKEVLYEIPLNRVEGDLVIKVLVADGQVTDVWSSGTMFRGFERMLIGRAPLDGLVITPRICGICSITHLTAAAKALDQVAGVVVPANAVRLRNVALMVETMQSDIRQSLLMYMVDFANVAHASFPWYDEAKNRYTPFVGSRCRDAVRETKRLLEIIAIIGGQWPHTSFMVPGGVVYAPQTPDLRKSILILDHFQHWYEQQVLGCRVEEWLAVDSLAALDDWLAKTWLHANRDVGFLLQAGRQLGLDRMGGGHGRFLSYGSLPIPEGSGVAGIDGQWIASGVIDAQGHEPFNPALIDERVACSWYTDYVGGRHPARGITDPIPSGEEGKKYSWSKAPRYNGRPAETGPLAERLLAGDALFRDLVFNHAPSALTRQLARITRPAHLFAPLRSWLEELARHNNEPFYFSPDTIQDGEGAGLLQAARGALGHWVRIEDSKIAHYQIITPTAWNGSPRDDLDVRGPWEEALIGVPMPDPDDPVLAGMVIRSFDPCLVCTVHVVGGKRLRLGG